ncbi:electron transfer flavoprotein subunit alpha [Ruminiclostridium cellulolyticum]|uniref:Electron transfer flavoprotein alpha subunit n=1 Tax=Ruminiclostridium cellulolyticum (strain ATCC 35319 / DSM 5812 / JCM 6584 / H10) TaxID=394503 RepID=B8I2G6_RUMCH|nr:electron transfer flavoprotein subunit alpha [Ruminiclostridium cellulolyticum]ACL75959.1 Electron transfer flavoprotein alpha subunit [Ruminiclostridium cellulolyticum H10]
MAELQILSDKCVKCLQCINVCPCNAIKNDKNVVYIDNTCTLCGICIPKCSFSAISYNENFTKSKFNIDEYNGILIFGEQRDGKVSSVVYELLGEGNRLARQLGTKVSVVLLGNNTDKVVRELFAFGADDVFQIDHPLLECFNDELYTDIVVQVILQSKPEIFLVGATTYGRSLAARVASRLNTGLTADCTCLEIDAEKRLLKQTRPAFSGNLMATIICPNHRPQMCTVRSKVMNPIEPDFSKIGQIIKPNVTISPNLKIKKIDSIKNKVQRVNLADADIIVSAGRGIQKPQNLELIREFADCLGAAVGSSRALVDAGWIEYSHQIGQTGINVRPKIYFACGISGAIQHLAGMMSAKYIIAINKDPNAPIFKVANLGMVGEIEHIIPALIKEVKNKKANT